MSDDGVIDKIPLVNTLVVIPLNQWHGVNVGCGSNRRRSSACMAVSTLKTQVVGGIRTAASTPVRGAECLLSTLGDDYMIIVYLQREEPLNVSVSGQRIRKGKIKFELHLADHGHGYLSKETEGKTRMITSAICRRVDSNPHFHLTQSDLATFVWQLPEDDRVVIMQGVEACYAHQLFVRTTWLASPMGRLGRGMFKSRR
ncbi:hypothetical protein K438DRAFT_1789164 [Mycena galopus ATCC 62051]|nr:hypothetical protein K438DRAFT_1789164 [Mycena galopus ATCC 62051]